VALVLAALSGAGLPVVLPGLFVVASGMGLVLPNATALAMADAAYAAGTASALVGVGQFAIAGIGAPLVGLGAAGTLLPMALVMAGFAVLGATASAFVARQVEPTPTPLSEPAATPPS
jgi:MFS transporter, DHA1 family, multidrug resistance protein